MTLSPDNMLLPQFLGEDVSGRSERGIDSHNQESSNTLRGWKLKHIFIHYAPCVFLKSGYLPLYFPSFILVHMIATAWERRKKGTQLEAGNEGAGPPNRLTPLNRKLN